MDGIEYDGAPKPMLIAYSVMTEKLEGAAPFEREVLLGDKQHCFVFSKGAGSVAVAWSWDDEGKKISVTLPEGLRPKVSNMMGHPVQAERDGRIVLSLDGNPLYVEAEHLPAQQLFAQLSRARVEKRNQGIDLENHNR